MTDNSLHDSQPQQHKLKIKPPSDDHKLRIAVHHPHPEHKITVRQQDVHQNGPRRPSQKAINRRTLVILANVAAAVLIIGISVGVVLKSNSAAKRREMLVAQARATAILEAEDASRKIAKVRSLFSGINARLTTYMTECSNTVALMPGGIPEVTTVAPPRRPASPPPDVATPPAADPAPEKAAAPAAEKAAAPAAEKAAASSAKEEAPSATPSPAPAEAEKDDPNRPFGEPSRDDLEKSRRADGAPKSEAETPPAAAPVQAAPVQKDDPNRPFGEPSREELDRKRKPAAVSALDTPARAAPAAERAAPAFSGPPAQTALVAARELEAAIQQRNEEAKELVSQGETLLEEAKTKTRPEDVAAAAARLREMAVSAQQAVAAAETSLTGIQEKLKDIRNLYAAYKEEQRKLATEQAAQRKKEEHEALIRSERESATAAAAATKTFFRDGSYTQAVQKLTVTLKQFTTDEARQIVQNKIDRFLLLRDLRNFLIEQSNKAAFAWGWGTGSTARDIYGSDSTYIRIRGGRVLWTDADHAQMAKFVDHYANDPKLQREVKARQLLAAAVYFNEAGLEEQAEAYRTKALQANRTLQTLADRLLPSQ